MARVTGVGGVFFKANDPTSLKNWYYENLGITPDKDGYVMFPWQEADGSGRIGATVWEPFPADTEYFAPSKSPFMINLRVDDLDAVLTQLRSAGAAVDEKIMDEDYGRFSWVMDPEGNRIELWEPKYEEANGEAAKDAVITTLLFQDKCLANAAFRDVSLADAVFRDVNLQGATFEDVNLQNARFHDVSLAGAVIEDCNIEGLRINGVDIAALLATEKRTAS